MNSSATRAIPQLARRRLELGREQNSRGLGFAGQRDLLVQFRLFDGQRRTRCVRLALCGVRECVPMGRVRVYMYVREAYMVIG
jgi:hypothetical protein